MKRVVVHLKDGLQLIAHFILLNDFIYKTEIKLFLDSPVRIKVYASAGDFALKMTEVINSVNTP